MKKIYALITGVLVSTLVFASGRDESPKETSGMAVVKKGSTSFKLIYKSELASDVDVKIFNASNNLVFAETIKNSTGFIRPYDFGKLDEGGYTIKVDNGSGEMMKNVQYQTDKARLVAQVIRISDKKMLLTVPGCCEDNLTIRILNQEGETIFRRCDNKVSGDFAEVFDVSHLKGLVSFEITNRRGDSTILTRSL